MKARIEGINQENIKHSNRSAILKLLCNEGAMSRKDIAAVIGLTPAAVTLICSDLIEEGIIEEKGEAAQEKKAGRKKILVDINYSYKNVLCIAIEADKTYITITDIGGTVIASKELMTDIQKTPEDFLSQVADISTDFISANSIAKHRLLGVGVSVPGIVDSGAGINLRSHGIWNKQVNVKAILEQKLQLQVVVENNVKAFAHGELLYGMGRNTNNLMFVKWGPGVGSAVTINHQVYEGRQFRGAEIGHYIIDSNGPKCRCGRKGCLETFISTHAFLDDVNKAYATCQMPILSDWLELHGNHLGVDNIEEWGAVGEAEVERIFDEKIDKLALTTENVVSILSPDKVIVYGKIFEIEGVLSRFKKSCKQFAPDLEDDYILKADMSDRITYIGPLAVAVAEFFF